MTENQAGTLQPSFVMLYTPLCGTCKVALRMLDIVEATDPSLRVERINLNASPELARRWHIGSVPCLAVIRQGEAVDTLYRMASVDTIYAWLRQRRDESTEPREDEAR